MKGLCQLEGIGISDVMCCPTFRLDCFTSSCSRNGSTAHPPTVRLWQKEEIAKRRRNQFLHHARPMQS